MVRVNVMYAAYIRRKIAASQRSRLRLLPVNIHIKSSTFARTTIRASMLYFWPKGRGRITEEVPRIRKMLNMFEPTILPTAISAFFL